MFETMIKNQTAKQAKELAAWMARREETVALPEGVWRTEDVAYLEDALPCHRMDLYQPHLFFLWPPLHATRFLGQAPRQAQKETADPRALMQKESAVRRSGPPRGRHARSYRGL